MIEEYIDYLITWITSHNDVEFTAREEFEIIRMIIDSYETFGCMMRGKKMQEPSTIKTEPLDAETIADLVRRARKNDKT